MKLAISNIAWSSEDDKEMHFFLKSAGFEGLEIAPTRIIPENPYDKLKEAEAFKNTLKADFSLTIPSLQAICFGRTEAIFATEEERESIKEYIKKAIDFASVLDCKNLVFGSPKNRIIGENQEDIALSFFNELGTYANEKNTILAMEPNPAPWRMKGVERDSSPHELSAVRKIHRHFSTASDPIAHHDGVRI